MKSKKLRILLGAVSVVSAISLVVCVNAVMSESIALLEDSVPVATVKNGATLDNVVTIEQNGDTSTVGGEAASANKGWSPVDNVADNPSNALPDAVEVNVPQEIVLTSTVEYRTPYTECSIHAVFTGPLGEKMTIPGFWDGEQTWKIRFAPPSEGKWTYVVECSNPADTGLQGKTGSFDVSAYTGDAEIIARGRLRKSDDGTYLTYSDGTPFFWLADTCWCAYTDRMKLNFSNREEYDSMFRAIIDARAEQGYTAYQTNLTFVKHTIPAENEGGVLWNEDNVWVDLNPEFLQGMDTRIEYMVEKGIVPVIGLGWSNSLTSGNYNEFIQFVRLLIARYSCYPIVWFTGGEWNFNAGEITAEPDNHGRLGYFIDANDPYCTLIGMHGAMSNPVDADALLYSEDYFTGQEWLDLLMVEGGHHVGWPDDYLNDNYATLNNHDYKVPWVEAEAKYEDIWEIPTDQTREVAYISMFNGSFGYGYGAEGLWYATYNSTDTDNTYGRDPTPWFKALEKRVGKKEMPLFKKIMTSLPWWKMENTDELVDWNEEIEEQLAVCKPTAMATEDRDWVAIYYPVNDILINGLVYADPEGVINGLSPDKTYEAYMYCNITGETYLLSEKLDVAADGTCEAPVPYAEELAYSDWVVVIRATDALTIEEEIALSAKGELKNRVLPLTTGEDALPEMMLTDPNAEVISFIQDWKAQGQNNLYFYTYDPVTETYTECRQESTTFGWGDCFFGVEENRAGITASGIAFPGAKTDLIAVWVAPSDGVVDITSLPNWKDIWRGQLDETFTLRYNDEVLMEVTFSQYMKSGSYNGRVEVKAGDTISWQLSLSDDEEYSTYKCQIDTATTYYFTAAEPSKSE